MSKILTKTVKKTTLLSIILAVILAAAIVVGIVCGVQGYGVFNQSALLKDSKTLTVSVNQGVYLTKLEDVEDYCEEAFEDLDIAYEIKGEMTGDESEIVYVFDSKTSETDLAEAKKALEDKFAALVDPENGEWKGSFITVAANSEEAVKVLAKNYVLRGVIAGVVLAVLVFAYVALRYRLNMGILAAVCILLGVALTAAIAILTRIPVTASVTYVLAVSGLLSAVMTLLTLNKIRANSKAENAEQSAEDSAISSIATKEILLFTVLGGAALVIVGAVATAGVRWFAVLALIALLVSAFMGLVYAPSLYIPLKKAADKKPVKDAYVGAKKTSSKVKKLFAKKEAEVKEEPTAEEAPVEETPAEAEEAPVEEAAEATAEENAEEASAERSVEEETEDQE